jgi:hypothetical protein
MSDSFDSTNVEPIVETIPEPIVEPTPETIVENIVEPIVESTPEQIVEKTFISIVEQSLTSLIIRHKLLETKIDLTPEFIDIIKKIISFSPDCFNDIEKAVSEIVKDGKIDSKDIPQFMIVVQKIYQLIYSLKDVKLDAKKRSEITCSVIKFVVHLLVLERKIIIDQDKESQFLTDCDILIDACIGLLSFPKAIKTKGCLKKIFG